MMPAAVIAVLGALLAVAVVGTWLIRRRNVQNWLGGYLWQSMRGRYSGRGQAGPVHVLLCIADHFEPSWGGATPEVADARVDAWVREYPSLLGGLRDSDGRPPRHTFFYPIDQYEARHVDLLAGLCRQGFGEIEIHLHHDHDTAENLEKTLHRFKKLLSEQHRVLGRTADGSAAYGFVHGNWALDNSRKDGRWCGVENELDVLRRTGCYADFTMPSAPDATQTRKINSIYYAAGRAGRCKSHDRGMDIGTGPQPTNSLLLIQGPLCPWVPWGDWRPRIENGCIQQSQPPTAERFDQWLRARVQVPARPDWVFVKLHTHGATEANQRVLLGDAMVQFHRALAQRRADNPNFHFHYVTAREMYNLAKAAESGWTGPVAGALDFAVRPPPS